MKQDRIVRRTAPLAALMIAALFAGSAAAAPTVRAAAGQTSVALSGDFVNALDVLGVSPAAIAPGSLANGEVSYPIPAGALDLATARGDIFHSGGLSLTAGGTTVELLHFVIDTTGDPRLTGLVTVDGDLVGRIPLFDLELTQAPVVTSANSIIVSGVNVTLTGDAADALNGVFGINDFVEGFDIGLATVVAQAMPPMDDDDDDEDEDEDDDDDRRRWRERVRRLLGSSR